MRKCASSILLASQVWSCRGCESGEETGRQLSPGGGGVFLVLPTLSTRSPGLVCFLLRTIFLPFPPTSDGASAVCPLPLREPISQL